jgi:hypothetical protein
MVLDIGVDMEGYTEVELDGTPQACQLGCGVRKKGLLSPRSMVIVRFKFCSQALCRVSLIRFFLNFGAGT